MDYNAIQNLLNQYFKGETSLEEENQLRQYFNSTNVDKRLVHFQSLFQFTQKEKGLQSPTQLGATILKSVKEGRVIGMSWKKWMAAACIILVSGLVIWNYTRQEEKRYAAVKEIQDPELAYQITKEALMLVSNKLNDGASKAADKVKKVKEMNRFVKEKR